MTARRLRESPRLVLATAAVAIVLVGIGILIGSAVGGGGSSASVAGAASLRARSSHQAAELRGANETILSLRTQLSAATQSLGLTRTQLTTARARGRCWKAAALRHATRRVPNCATQT